MAIERLHHVHWEIYSPMVTSYRLQDLDNKLDMLVGISLSLFLTCKLLLLNSIVFYLFSKLLLMIFLYFCQSLFKSSSYNLLSALISFSYTCLFHTVSTLSCYCLKVAYPPHTPLHNHWYKCLIDKENLNLHFKT